MGVCDTRLLTLCLGVTGDRHVALRLHGAAIPTPLWRPSREEHDAMITLPVATILAARFKSVWRTLNSPLPVASWLDRWSIALAAIVAAVLTILFSYSVGT